MARLANLCPSLLIVALAGCTPIYMNVRAYADPAAASARTFAVVSINQTSGGELVERELLELISRKLVQKGLTRVDLSEEPDVLIAVSGYIGSYEQYVPPSTIYIPTTERTTSTTQSSGTVSGASNGWVGGTYVTGSAQGTYSGTDRTTTTQTVQTPVVIPGYTVTNYYRHLAVVMSKVIDSTPHAVWTGEVESRGSGSDLVEVAPYLLKELFEEFPRRSHGPSQRMVLMSGEPGEEDVKPAPPRKPCPPSAKLNGTCHD